MAHAAMPGMDGKAANPVATSPQIAAMTVLTLLALSAGVIIATLFGSWAM
jgi:hypothetical protein